jgi:hypothetical protein
MRFGHVSHFLRAVFVCLILTFALGGPSLPVSAAATTTVSVSTPTQIVSPGSQFTIRVDIQPNSSIAGAQFCLSFNPSLVSINSVIEGNLFKQAGASTYFSPGKINNATGTLTDVAGVIITPGQTISSMGTLALITMTARSDRGTSAITLSNVVIGDTSGQSVLVRITNGEISVDRTPALGSIGNKTVNINSTLSFNVSATDPDGDYLTYSAFNLPAGANFNTSTRTFSWTPSLGQGGIYNNVHFETTDGIITVYENITITVNKLTPIFSNLSAPTINYGDATTNLSGIIQSNSLIPGGSLSITLNGVTQSATIDGTGCFSSSFVTSAIGTTGSPYTIQYVYGGDTNFNNLSDSGKTLTVIQAYSIWDVNSDGNTNVLDMIGVSQQWGASGFGGWIRQDINSDGIINVLDLIIIGQHWTG